MGRRYKEKGAVSYTTVSTHILKGVHGVSIYAERRPNHMKNAIHTNRNGEESRILEHDYLTFKIQGKQNALYHSVRHLAGVNVTFLEDCTEIACHHPQVYHNTLLSELERQRFIKHTWIESVPEEEGHYPLYINARYWQVFYNLCSLAMGSIHKAWIQRFLKEKNSK